MPDFHFRLIIAALALPLALLAHPASAGDGARPIRLAQIPLPNDEVLWNTIRDKGYLELYEYFLSTYPMSRRAEEARLAIAILKGEIDPNAPAEEPEADEAEIEDDLGLDPLNLDVAEFQRALRARGCNAGIDDGIWGERTAGAAQRFADALGLAVDPSRPNVGLFGAVLRAEGDICGEI